MLPGPVSWVARLPFRLARAISRRTRRALSRDGWTLLRRNLLFPMRNVLLLNRRMEIHVGGLNFSIVPKGHTPLDMWARRYFESHELELVLDVLSSGMTFVDVGANVGLFSIPAAMKVDKGLVISFEPTLSTHATLVKNVQLNRLSNVRPVRSALGDYTGEAVLKVNVQGKDGLNTIGKPTHDQCEIAGSETVAITTLDKFLAENGTPRVDVIKVHVEGGELLVLCGARELLASADAPLIVFECSRLSRGFGYHPAEILWLLEELGYESFVIDPSDGAISRPANSQSLDTNMIAVKPTHRAYGAVRERAR